MPKAAPRLPPDPLWYKDAVIYQLHVKSFFDSTDDGVGDFAGLIARLDHIVSLGVTAIWLLPFYPSPRRDDGYDIADYRGVHPDYGRMADVRRFIDEAHARGLRVITELVINHTSDQHPWFQRARAAKPGSAWRRFYVWSDTDHRYEGTRIIFCDTESSNWTWDPVAGAYYWHRFYSHQPDLNFDNPQVLRAVLGVMRFWLDMGVDGMRLDAAPYLVEREGTNNENLPETHQILKRIRAEVDARYADRLLLAEANQWPEDTQEYFGSGDECHMAFHFPLMPRMYMAIAQEDRFPVTDIMRQTPAIPPNCQWAIFLRNHDELTLEMVTDKERDYLWSVYASDRRARINLGIRRRLAPLMERDRRRIELMNFMLLTMPGTPVLYYGDEIGMGDNIHLGDRDGVRTPMQWSPDRNGGFSRADPAELVLPPIADPLYGYEVVNVEAQGRDPHSLLNWLRRMLAVRKEHQAFGRGSLRFLRPQNRKIMAWLREHEGPDSRDVILCVANVSRTAQAVELDLSEFAGRTPLELSGKAVFPTLGQLTYLLTLPPYGFYWFQLCEDTPGPNWSTSSASTAPEHYTLVVRDNFATVAEDGNRALLEGEVLPTYVGARRWYAAKDTGLLRVRLVSAAPLPGGGDQLMTQVEVDTTAGTARYTLPLGADWEDQPSGPYAPTLALGRVRRGSHVGYLTDAFALPAFARAVIRGLKQNARIPTPDGEMVFQAVGALDLPDEPDLEWLAAEQSNSTLVIERKAVLKLLRKVEAGIHPEAEMTRVLTERGFRNAPQLLGEVYEACRDGQVRTLMIMQGFVYSQGDAWAWTLDYIERAADDLALAGEDGAEPAFGGYEAFARTFGRRLAEMHAVLAQPTDDPAFAPEPADEAAVDAWTGAVRGQLAAAFACIAGHGDFAGPDEAAAAGRLISGNERLTALVGDLAQAGRGALRTRIHGDLHLGQVLVTGGDATIIDFEGEPARSLAERRAKSSPLKDVAGVLRSIDYAAAVAARSHPTEPEAAAERKRGLLERFRRDAAEAFLDGYREAGGQPDGPLLQLFLLEKAAYEVCYEASSRPDWIGVPLMGLAALAQSLLDRQETPQP
jgi:maltose alpha-D-glucosyltransferase/alpha-amylase